MLNIFNQSQVTKVSSNLIANTFFAKKSRKKKKINLENTKTKVNLMTAFAGESQARNRYTYFAAKAFKEGYVKISKIFDETAKQEKIHAKRFFEAMTGGTSKVRFDAEFDFGVVGSTKDNLKSASMGEKHEHEVLYPEFAKVAREEGFEEIAKLFEHISVAEKHHEERYVKLLEDLKKDKVFTKEEVVVWRCLNCGYLHWGVQAPYFCPACGEGQAYFEELNADW
ncbi:rubrerythrin-related [Anaeramoeba flamelloides]|uniref:Rubrerythrin-related n=1 Tax=Anaeramoeba flamelloides TaxID=1746091 RepID=A0AAV7Z852_9EUKA|nr:rubrerythrin-related [Anaeramoeba flamelloides]